jgi:hypothetical protein
VLAHHVGVVIMPLRFALVVARFVATLPLRRNP